MNYTFIVRDWSVDFFIQLTNTISENEPDADIVYLCMTSSAKKSLKQSNIKAIYLPDLFEDVDINNDEIVNGFNNFLEENFNFGVDFLYEMERFKPNSIHKKKFIQAHIIGLVNSIPKASTFVSLTCDHFVFILASYVNLFKGGNNCFVQPIGFPLNAQIILKTPFEQLSYRKAPYEEDKFLEYTASLSLKPSESIHYMQPQRLLSLQSSVAKKINQLINYQRPSALFGYLEPKGLSLIPGRFTEKTKIDYRFNYFNIGDLKNNKEDIRIFYFPLQFEPEMSIMVYSPFFEDQIEIIRLINQSLKYGDKLLIKENPKMQGLRSREFYDQISAFSNVFWVDPKENSREIIRLVDKVISVTGTATIEAACLGVNSMMFGYPPFHYLLKQKTISETSLSTFRQSLYTFLAKEEILHHIKSKWPEFSKAIFFHNTIPSYVGNDFKVKDAINIAHKLYNEVLVPSKDL